MSRSNHRMIRYQGMYYFTEQTKWELGKLYGTTNNGVKIEARLNIGTYIAWSKDRNKYAAGNHKDVGDYIQYLLNSTESKWAPTVGSGGVKVVWSKCEIYK